MSTRFVLGIDIGGTTYSVGSVATDGSRVAVLHEEPTRPERGADDVLARIIALGKRTMDETRTATSDAEFIGVGAGAPGPLNRASGIVLLTPNLGWVDFPLRDRLAKGLGCTTEIDNDANCAVLGECWRGAAQGAVHALGVTIGTGIGGGIVLGRRLYHGASDCAGEIGHTTIEANGRRCNCGNYGCLEAYASGSAIARRAVEALDAGAESTLPSLVDGALDQITAQTVYEAASAGDELSREVVQDTAKFLGAGFANLVNIFNPDTIVVCGGVTRAGELLFAPLRREVAKRAFKPAVAAVRIVPGTLEAPGVYGAAKAFLDARG